MDNKQHILILEDDPDTRALIKMRLKSKLSDIVIYEAKDPLMALEVLHKNAGKITHIISDHYMPNESGLNFCELIKSRAPHIKIYLLSADSSLSKNRQIYCVDRFFVKPSGINQIEKEIRQDLMI